MKFLFLMLALVAVAMGASAAGATPIPAGPAVVNVPVAATAVTSAALEGAPDELTVSGTRCTGGTCTVSVTMAEAGRRDLRGVDPARVATLVVAGRSGTERIDLPAAPSLRAAIASAGAAHASLQRLLGVLAIIVMSVVSVIMIEMAPFRVGVRVPRRVTIVSWVVGLLPVAAATAVVVSVGAGSRGFLMAALFTSLFIPVFRVMVMEVAAIGRTRMAA